MNHVTLSTRSPLRDNVIYTLTAIGVFLLVVAYSINRDYIPSLLFIGLVVYLGFGLPRWIGLGERKRRAYEAKEKEHATWGFHGRDREGAWINYIDYPLVKETDIAKGKYFYSDWLIIHDGFIVVNPGGSSVDRTKAQVTYDHRDRRTYAWDGCSPKRLFLWLALIGTPDWWQRCEDIQTLDDQGRITTKNVFWPIAHYASLVHDALYQYLGIIPIAKKEVDQQFHDMLIASRLPPFIANLYHLAVRKLGASDIPEDQIGPNSTSTVSGFPFPPAG